MRRGRLAACLEVCVARLFGTDGVRGLANGDLTPELALAVASAAARVLVAHDASAPRRSPSSAATPGPSGEMLEAAVVAGLHRRRRRRRAARRAADPGGRLPDRRAAAPTSAWCSPPRTTRCRTTASSCSRAGGAQAARRRSRTRSRRGLDAEPATGPTGAAIGRVRDADADAARALRRPPAARPSAALDGLHVVVDCAHGAASRGRARGATARAGATVTAIARASPTGATSTTACGSTHLESLRRRGRASTAPTSASRTTATPTAASPSTRRARSSTATRSWPCCALALQARPALPASDTLVATVMSNLGLHHAMRARGHRASSPPRSATGTCWRRCARGGYRLGGEQSGHVVLARPRHHRRRAAHRAAA